MGKLYKKECGALTEHDKYKDVLVQQLHAFGHVHEKHA